MRRAFFFIAVFFFASASFASIPRTSVLDDAPSRFELPAETCIGASDVLASFQQPVPSPLSRALRQAYEELSTTNASGLAGFLSVDPVLNVKRALRQPQNWNRYSYVMNNPLRYTDPDGRDHYQEPEFTKPMTAENLAMDENTPAVIKGAFYAEGALLSLAAGEGAWVAAGRMISAARAWWLGSATLSGAGGREMLGNAMARVQSFSGSMADKANLFEKLSNQISKATNGSWSAARSTAVDGSQVFLGRQGEALIINAEGQLFRTKLGTGLVQEGKNLKVLWDVIRESVTK